jgi:8-oxo-dGTP diphosphatase
MPRVPDDQELPVLSVHAGMITVIVTAAVVERDGRFLVTRRPAGVHLEGYWEFPGGKCEPGETLEASLTRELREELAVDAVVGEKILATSHSYPERRVELHFFNVDLRGEPAPQLGQELRWISRDALGTLKLPPADDELVALLTASQQR